MQDALSLEQNGQTKPATRTRILGLRISESEIAALERKAWQAGKTVAEWAREVLLGELRDAAPRATQTHIFTELVAIQLVMMNAMEPLLRGEKLSREQVASIFREVQATKAARAQEILLKRAQAREK
jgi:mobilization protein NikA